MTRAMYRRKCEKLNRLLARVETFENELAPGSSVRDYVHEGKNKLLEALRLLERLT